MMLAVPSVVKPSSTGSLPTKSKDRRRLSSVATCPALRRQPSSFANDASRRASFQKGDNVDGNYIVSYLETNPQIQELYCEEVMGPEYLGPMHRVLVNHHSSIHLHALELPKNELSADAGDDLSDIIQSQQQTLFKLDLSGNPLTVVGCSLILDPLITESFPSRLRILNLSETQLGSKGATAIAAILRYNKSIRELYLGHNKIGTKGIKILVTGLAANSTLQVLDVRYNAIKKQGATILAEFLQSSKESNVRVIDVTCNNLGPAGIQSFAKLLAVDRRLERFYAGHNDLGEMGASVLRNALKLNYSLKELRLEENHFGNAGTCMLADSLGENEHRTSAVEKLVLGYNGIGLEGASSLAELLKENSRIHHLDLAGNNICCAGAMALADSLSYNISLKELVLTQNSIEDNGAFALALAMGKPTCSLETLHCHENPIADKGQASLDRIPQLRRNQKYWLDPLMRDMSKGSVTSVNLVDRNIGDEELMLLTGVIATTSPMLRSFWLSGVSLSPRSLVPFCECAFGPSSKIVRLYMKTSNCGDEIAKVLATTLRQNTNLEVLSLTDVSLSAIGASALAEGLSENTVLRRLNLDRNHIGDVGMTALGQVIPQTSLISLSVSSNSLTDQSMNLEGTKHLEELTMNGNRITDVGAIDFCRVMVNGGRLVWLSLRHNLLTKRGGDVIKSFLPSDATVDY